MPIVEELVQEQPRVSRKPLVAQVPYGEFTLPTLRLARSSRRVRWIARILLALLVFWVFAMLLLPWQQSVTGSGRVVAFAPLMREQTIQAPITGRVVQWSERLVEGARFEKGEVILEIQDLDPELVARLRDQEQASLRKLETARIKVKVYASQVEAFVEAREMAITAAEEQVKSAKQKIRAEQQSLVAALAAERQEQLNYEQLKQAAADQIASGYELQVAERKYEEAKAKVEQARAYVDSAGNELAAKEAELVQKEREAQAKVESARAYLQDAEGEVAIADKDLADIRIKVSRQESQVVRAPQDGYIFRLMVNPGADMIKAGDPLFTLVPETADRAVELWVDGNDAPLVTPGRHVRLQFEGWPAVQFAGWPSVAVGTFGGQVATMDATDEGGRFRILVVPAPGEEWPEQRYLRQGVRANGWVLLNEVKLGYELWRQMNGFPPVIEKDEAKAKPPTVLKKGK